ncbi:MAG TPA: hypothetical protein VMF06_06885 [Candidatus Limnocylindria bacterium]|nr:hypothetical protein [Candidatus Limnocylindria bacterium]
MKHTLRDGILGMATSAGGITVSMLPAIEQGLRIVSLLVGIAVGVTTLVSLIRRLGKGN